MCIRISSGGKPEAQQGPPPITPRVEKDTSTLPAKTDLVKKDDERGVEFGSSKKEGLGIGKVSKGTEALRIPLNTGGTTGGSGTNV